MNSTNKIGIVLPRYNDLVKDQKYIFDRIKKIYSKVFKYKNIKFYWHDFDCNLSDLTNIAVEIITDKPNKLIVCDKTHPPYHILKLLLSNKTYNPEIYIDIWNNLINDTTQWHLLGQLLREKGIKTQIISSTKIQEKFINQFLNNVNNAKTVTKPIIDKTLFFDPTKRELWRKENNILDDEFIVFVSCDLTIESSYWIVLKEILNAFSASNRKIKLIISGKHKDEYIKFWNINPLKGYSFHHFNTIFFKMKTNYRNNIKYLPNIKHDQIPYILNGIDCTINLSLNQTDSLHHTSLSQALACGSPCIALNWGGINTSKYVKNINVSISNKGLLIDRPQISSKIIKELSRFNSFNKSELYAMKEKISKETLSHFSTTQINKELINAFTNPPNIFLGFNWKLKQTISIDLHSKYCSIEGSLYKEIYDCYNY